MDYLRHVPSFGKLSKEKLEKLFEVLDLQDYAAGETVFKKGEVSARPAPLTITSNLRRSESGSCLPRVRSLAKRFS